MRVRNKLVKVAVVSLTAGAVMIGGLGLAGTASADGGNQPGPNQNPGIGTPAPPPPPRLARGLAGGASSDASPRTSFVKTDLRAAAARQIGISDDVLNRETAQGKSIAQVAAQHGVDYAALKTTLVNAMDADLQQATANGTVSQAQANQIVSNIPHMVESFLARSQGHAGAGPAASGQPAPRFGGQAPNRGVMRDR